MKPLKNRVAWSLAASAAVMATVVAFASPAAAAVPSTTTLQASPSAAAVGQPVTLTATVVCSQDPTGGLGVTFFDGPDLLTTVPVNPAGVATYTAQLTTAGTHVITAAYNGNANCSASNDETTVVMSPALPDHDCDSPFHFHGSHFPFDIDDLLNDILSSALPGWTSSLGASGLLT